MNDRMLIVDEDRDHAAFLQKQLEGLGYPNSSIASAHEVLSGLTSGERSILLLDIGADEASGLVLCQQWLAAAPEAVVILLAREASLATAVSAIRAGAFDYLPKPLDLKLLGLSVARAARHVRTLIELKQLRDEPRRQEAASPLLGQSPGMRRLRALITKLGDSDASILIQGETGSGKELVARALHAASSRASGPFVAINCASMPLSLLESELFGHEKGAFTDAKAQRAGLFLQATGGTLFLDEIGEMPLAMQSKLLRALQERVVRPVGSSVEIPFDVRLFSATHRDLDADVEAGRFRRDLLYRVNVVSLEVPPLRERVSDILRLASHFLAKSSAETRRPPVTLSRPVADCLIAYDWPGNVRELENCMARVAAVAMFEQAAVDDLPEIIRGWRTSVGSGQGGGVDAIVSMDELHRGHILRVLDQVGGNKSRASQVLGLDRRTLYRKLDEYRRAGDGSALLAMG
jgi:DNA-binding NtrC family response regulator